MLTTTSFEAIRRRRGEKTKKEAIKDLDRIELKTGFL